MELSDLENIVSSDTATPLASDRARKKEKQVGVIEVIDQVSLDRDDTDLLTVLDGGGNGQSRRVTIPRWACRTLRWEKGDQVVAKTTEKGVYITKVENHE